MLQSLSLCSSSYGRTTLPLLTKRTRLRARVHARPNPRASSPCALLCSDLHKTYRVDKDSPGWETFSCIPATCLASGLPGAKRFRDRVAALPGEPGQSAELTLGVVLTSGSADAD